MRFNVPRIVVRLKSCLLRLTAFFTTTSFKFRVYDKGSIFVFKFNISTK